MIGRLRGEILLKRPPWLLVDVGGVGYELEAPMSTFYELPAVGERVTLVTHLLVREDAHALYGFARERDRDLFRALLRVSGVGAKMGLAILSGMDAAQFTRCVELEDVKALTRLPGIGAKTAQRLVMEMRDRVGGIGGGSESLVAPTAPGNTIDVVDDVERAVSDAVSALVALGYKPADATRMVRAVEPGITASEEIIRAALRAVTTR